MSKLDVLLRSVSYMWRLVNVVFSEFKGLVIDLQRVRRVVPKKSRLGLKFFVS